MRIPGFIGPSYELASKNADCQRTVNWMPELNEVGSGKEREIAAMVCTPGLRLLATVGTGPIRCIHEDLDGRVLVVSGNKLYKMTEAAGVWTGTQVGSNTFNGSTGIVRAASAYVGRSFASTGGGFEAVATTTVFVDGSADNYAFNAFTHPVDIYHESPEYPKLIEEFAKFGAASAVMDDYVGVAGATHVLWLDGYFIFNDGGDKFLVSEVNLPSVDPLEFAAAEGDPDNILAVDKNSRDLWILGERTTEVFVNTGNADFPFERVSGGFIEMGTAAKHSVAQAGGALFWLGRSKHGAGQVYAAQGLTPQRVSTHAIEKAISGYADISTATAWSYEHEGHDFYVLNFAEATWVYDLSTKLWHERAYTSSGALQRHRADRHCFISAHALHMVGDYANGKVYALERGYFTDAGAAITRMRRSPHQTAGLKRVSCSSFQLDAETGVGLDGSVQGSDPQIMLRWSDDGGHTWSNEKITSLGKIGERLKRVVWRRLGMFRDRVWEVKCTDPVDVTLLGAEAEMQTEAS
jgi:hypothetical protein